MAPNQFNEQENNFIREVLDKGKFLLEENEQAIECDQNGVSFRAELDDEGYSLYLISQKMREKLGLVRRESEFGKKIYDKFQQIYENERQETINELIQQFRGKEE